MFLEINTNAYVNTDYVISIELAWGPSEDDTIIEDIYVWQFLTLEDYVAESEEFKTKEEAMEWLTKKIRKTSEEKFMYVEGISI